MHLNNLAILITADINKILLNEIRSKGFIVDVISFIQTKIIKEEKVQKQIEDVLQLNANVVFTSSKAVEVIGRHFKNIKPAWKIYCVGNATKILIEKTFDKASVIAVADNAADLVQKIIADKKSVNEIYFFCGDKRRHELPYLLQSNNINVNEIEVYQTIILKHTIEKNYDAILFFSPSAAEGFFKINSVNEQTVLFAIGNTTAMEIKKYSQNKIVVGNKPGKQDLIEKLIGFFKE